MPTGAGVFEFDSDGLSPFELVAVGGGGILLTGAGSFDGVASLTGLGMGAKVCNALGDSLRVMIMLGFDDFRRAVGTAGVFVDEAIVILLMVERRGGRWMGCVVVEGICSQEAG